MKQVNQVDDGGVPQITMSDDEECEREGNHIEKKLNSLLEETRRELVNFDQAQQKEGVNKARIQEVPNQNDNAKLNQNGFKQ